MLFNFLLAKTIEISYGLSIALTITCLVAAIICFLLQWILTIKYFSRIRHSDTWWFFIKRYFLLICGFMFLIGFIGSLVSFIKFFA